MRDKIKGILRWVIIGLFVIQTTICIVQCNTNKHLQKRYEISTSNEKSLLNRLEENGETIIEYQATMDMLRHTNDSVIQNLLQQQQNLKIKNKDLQNMVSMTSQFHVHDTLQLHDTIFKNPSFELDTCFRDEWRTTCLDMKYPGDICVDATTRSQKDVYITAKRETIDPPKKFFLFRWFQKKHTVTRIVIHEENPYIESQENVYIRVLDK